MAKGRKRRASDLEEDRPTSVTVAAATVAPTARQNGRSGTGDDGGAGGSRSVDAGCVELPSADAKAKVKATVAASMATAAPSSRDNEVRFGKQLASSDKRVRDRTVSALREWLHQRSKGGALTDLDLLKVGWRLEWGSNGRCGVMWGAVLWMLRR